MNEIELPKDTVWSGVIHASDFKIDVYSILSSGFGYPRFGVKVTHTPTGLSEANESERSQHANHNQAYERLLRTLERSTPIPLACPYPDSVWKDAVLNLLAEHAIDAPITEHPKDILKRILDVNVSMNKDLPSMSQIELLTDPQIMAISVKVQHEHHTWSDVTFGRAIETKVLEGLEAIAGYQSWQWWYPELELAVKDGTHDQKRAVAVVKRLLDSINHALSRRVQSQTLGD